MDRGQSRRLLALVATVACLVGLAGTASGMERTARPVVLAASGAVAGHQVSPYVMAARRHDPAANTTPASVSPLTRRRPHALSGRGTQR